MDLSGVYFTMGTVLQNNAPLSSLTPQDVCSNKPKKSFIFLLYVFTCVCVCVCVCVQVEREVVEVLMKALTHTEALLNTIDKEHPKCVCETFGYKGLDWRCGGNTLNA